MWGARSKIKWQAADGRTDILLAGSFVKTKPASASAQSIPPGTLNILGQGTPGLYNTNSDIDEFQKYRQYTIAATIDHDFDFARLTSITAYDVIKSELFTDADASPAPVLNIDFIGKSHTLSQEFHLQSNPGSRLKWIIGGLYLDNWTPGKNAFIFNGVSSLGISKTTTRSFAAFGQATYPILTKTNLTAGFRFTHDKSTLAVPGASLQTTKAGKPTWRLALDHELAPDILGYASYSRGFKSGLFNATDPLAAPAKPETLDAYEVGLKSEFLDHRLRFNAAVYHYDFKGVQVQLFDQRNSAAFIANAGNARSNGLDVDLAAEPLRGLTLTGGLSLMDTKFTSGPADSPCFSIPAPPAVGLIRGACPLSGNRLPFAPKATVSFGLDYKVTSDIGEVRLSTAINHNSGYFNDPSNFAPARAHAYDMLSSSIGWTSRSGTLHASIWGKNLLDEKVIGSADVGAGLSNTTLTYPLAPRTFGGTVGVSF